MNLGEIIDFIKMNTNLPGRDIFKISYECWLKGYDKYKALEEAKKLSN